MAMATKQARDARPPTPETGRTALVMSGGGARGAYEAGVLSYLFEAFPEVLGRPVHFDIVTGIRAAGTTVLMVEQNASAALDMCDHAYLLESGSLAIEGSGRELIDNPHVRQAYLAG